MGNIICKNDKDFFQMLIKGIEYRNKEHLTKCNVALQAFLGKPQVEQKKIQALKKKVQAVGVGTAGDFQVLTKDSFNVTLESDNFDLDWQLAFRQISLGRNQDSWEIYNVANSLTFNKVEEGQRIEAAGLTGTKTSASVDYYGGAIGWTDKMIRYRKVPAMIQLAEVFRNKFWTNKADNHYALLAAAAALNVTAYQGVVADGQLQRDIQTINRAAFTLTNRLKDKGYGNTANARLIMYANPLDKNRIEAAFRSTTQALATAGRTGDVIGYNITVRYTFNSNVTSGTPILIFPGQKIQKADDMQPTPYGPELDILTLNRVQSVWAIYGAIVADTDQAETITLG